jgi:WD40 repeat protein
MRGVAFSPDGNRVMTGDEAITAVKVWDVSLDGGAEIASLPGVRLFGGSVAFTPDGRRLLATSAEGTVTVWDPHRRRQLLVFGPNGPSSGSAGESEGMIDGPSGTDVVALDVNADGRLVATASFDGLARVWDAATGDEALTVHRGTQVDDIAWSPNGDLLATATSDGDSGLVTIVDRSGDEVATLHEEPGIRFGSVSFSPDGRLLATSRLPTGRPDPDVARVNLWAWERGEVVSTIEAPAERAFFAPSGDRIATMAWNGARHLETWFGIMGMGGVYHTVNPRLHEAEIAWIINHAEDRILFADLTFVALLESLRDRLPPLAAIVLLTDAAHMPDTPLDADAPAGSMAENASTAVVSKRTVRRIC